MSELLNNRANRIDTLKRLIRHLHAGHPADEVRAELRDLVQECDATEIAQMEHELMAEGVSVEEIMSMCDLHAQVVSEILADRPVPLLSPGHPVKTFQNENRAIERQVGLLRESLSALNPGDGLDPRESPPRHAVEACLALLNELLDIEKHYDRKEHLLFSMLERHGITGPSKVMWAKDDEVRELLMALRETLLVNGVSREEWAVVGSTIAAPALDSVMGMVFKEDRILLPMALQTLTEVEWGEIWSQSPQFGWCLVDPEDGYTPPSRVEPELRDGFARGAGDISLGLIPPATGRVDPPKTAVMFPTGALTPEQLIAMFSLIPLDLTFVDADDRVRFFSEGPNRVFVRPKAVIGRRVQHCHPPSSVNIVDEILTDFRAGRESVADFWIELRGRFVLIRYFAVRDGEGRYMGTLEVTQDLTRERRLTGERRLLQYDSQSDGECDEQ